MEHSLKIERPYYDAVCAKIKTFEIRDNDRGFQKGDTVILVPLKDGTGITDASLPKIKAKIGYVTPYKQQEGYVVFSLLNVKTIGLF